MYCDILCYYLFIRMIRQFVIIIEKAEIQLCCFKLDFWWTDLRIVAFSRKGRCVTKILTDDLNWYSWFHRIHCPRVSCRVEAQRFDAYVLRFSLCHYSGIRENHLFILLSWCVLRNLLFDKLVDDIVCVFRQNPSIAINVFHVWNVPKISFFDIKLANCLVFKQEV